MTSRDISPNLVLRAQNLKVNLRSFELDINASQACLNRNWNVHGNGNEKLKLREVKPAQEIDQVDSEKTNMG